jgi:A/G-specific adenine glycosylase
MTLRRSVLHVPDLHLHRPGTDDRDIDIEAFHEALLGWARTELRDLPWRATRDPWAVLVSEVMLQQTQVARVIPKWHTFLAEYPTTTACAEADLPRLLELWQGLGYPRRVMALRSAAIAIETTYGGVFPVALEALLGLPGVGPYTARAILAFAFETDVGVVDTNSARVIARALTATPLSAKAVQALADQLTPDGRGWIWNQAMLDLGARNCTKRQPDCITCPLTYLCRWRLGLAAAELGNDEPPLDPSIGTAGVSGIQSRFAGSDRQGRGRLLRVLGDVGVVHMHELADVMGWPGEHVRADRVATSLAADCLIAATPDGLSFSLAR